MSFNSTEIAINVYLPKPAENIPISGQNSFRRMQRKALLLNQTLSRLQTNAGSTA
jgi:hypothetical protein